MLPFIVIVLFLVMDDRESAEDRIVAFTKSGLALGMQYLWCLRVLTPYSRVTSYLSLAVKHIKPSLRRSQVHS